MALDILNADFMGPSSGGYEPQRVNNALMTFQGPFTVEGKAVGSGGDDELTLALDTFPVPKDSNGIIEAGWLNEKRKFAGLPIFDDLSVVYKDFVDRDTARMLRAWRYSVYNPETGKIGLASDYKKTGWTSLFAPNGAYVRSYELIGAWPSAMDPGDIDMAGEDIIRITMTITIDKAIPRQGLNPAGREQIGTSPAQGSRTIGAQG